jgi:hypothetical protein
MVGQGVDLDGERIKTMKRDDGDRERGKEQHEDKVLAEKVRACMAAINQSATLGRRPIAECPSFFAFGHIYELVKSEVTAVRASSPLPVPKDERMFQIMGELVASREAPIPWSIFTTEDEQWAQRNHSQTLQRLNERGGLAPSEAVAVLEHRRWEHMDHKEADKRLREIVSQRLSASSPPQEQTGERIPNYPGTTVPAYGPGFDYKEVERQLATTKRLDEILALPRVSTFGDYIATDDIKKLFGEKP